MVNDWKELFDKIAGFKNTQTLHPKHLFRGQACSEWKLDPSFTRIAKKRCLDRTQTLQLERETVNKFSISGSKLLPLEYTIDLALSRFTRGGTGIDLMGWLVVMQHYGAPTRTLDWSSSPWVALYFACCERDEQDGVLWIADFAKVDEYAKKALPDTNQFVPAMTLPTAPEVLIFTTPRNTNQRVESQQARSSVCTNPLSDHLPILEKAGALVKIVIPRKSKSSIMIELNQMNISARTLFPGIDGLGKSITEYCNLWDKLSKIE